MDRPGRSPRGAAGRVAVCGALSAILTVSKLAMSFLPNIEPVSLLLMVYARVLGRSVFYVLVPFVAVDAGAKALREGGRLADIAPTMLEILGLPQPPEMDGVSLLVR